MSKGPLHKPSLYLSDFFERNRSSYYDALTAARVSGGLNQWVRFFLVGVGETADKGRDTFQKILALRNEAEASVVTLGRGAPSGRALLHLLYRKPVVTAPEVERLLRECYEL